MSGAAEVRSAAPSKEVTCIKAGSSPQPVAALFVRAPVSAPKAQDGRHTETWLAAGRNFSKNSPERGRSLLACVDHFLPENKDGRIPSAIFILDTRTGRMDVVILFVFCNSARRHLPHPHGGL